jgi:hypothetical protein
MMMTTTTTRPSKKTRADDDDDDGGGGGGGYSARKKKKNKKSRSAASFSPKLLYHLFSGARAFFFGDARVTFFFFQFGCTRRERECVDIHSCASAHTDSLKRERDGETRARVGLIFFSLLSETLSLFFFSLSLSFAQKRNTTHFTTHALCR